MKKRTVKSGREHFLLIIVYLLTIKISFTYKKLESKVTVNEISYGIWHREYGREKDSIVESLI